MQDRGTISRARTWNPRWRETAPAGSPRFEPTEPTETSPTGAVRGRAPVPGRRRQPPTAREGLQYGGSYQSVPPENAICIKTMESRGAMR